MMKKILIINSDNAWDSKYNLSIYDNLTGRETQFLLLSNNSVYRNYFAGKGLPRFSLPGIISPAGFFSTFIFVLTLPLTWVVAGLAMIYFKKSHGVSSLLLYGLPEKIIFTPIAKILVIDSIWMEMPMAIPVYRSFISKKLLAYFSGGVKIIVYCRKTQLELTAFGISPERIEVIIPGVDVDQGKHQENIFDSMAEKESRFRQRKFFTIGTENELAETEKIKTLLQAVEKCMDVIPNLQIIIIGEGPEKKNLSWLVRKMGIENIVWFIGKQNNFGKWLSNLDVLIYTKNHFDLDDMNALTKASAAGVPIICPNKIGLEDIVVDKVNGLLIEPSSDDLVEAIISLEQNNGLSQNLSRQAKELAGNQFNIQNTINSFKKIIGL